MHRYIDQLNRWRENDRLRILRETRRQGNAIHYEDKKLIDLSSNDYLGIGSDPDLWRDFMNEEVRYGGFGGGACSSRLLTGNHEAYVSLEKKLAEAYGAESALVFASGYHANIGILPALTSKKDLVIADKSVHASLIDGLRLCRSEVIRFPHNDTARLEAILRERRESYDHVFIVTESVFSMDGDLADLTRLVELKKKYDAYLYVDEAHGVGIRGERGLGLAEETGQLHEIDLLVGTFGKAYASAGAFLVSHRLFRDFLVNAMRSMIFSTGLPPISLRWTERVLGVILSATDKREHLAFLSHRLRCGLREAGLTTAGESQIVPLMAGGNERAVRWAGELMESGFFALPIRTPTVPAGTERLRFSLTAGMAQETIDKLIEVCARIGS